MDSKALKKQVDTLERQLIEKDEINNEQNDKIMQLDECLSEKNMECQTLFASIQKIEQAKYWQEQLYNNA